MTIRKKENIALYTALVIHICGAIGILFTPYKKWFISSTPLNILCMTALLLFTQKNRPFSFWLFWLLCIITGFTVEVIGINTGYLFGNYAYGEILGPQLFHVPLIIGLNWFITIYCAGSVVYNFSEWLLGKFSSSMAPSAIVQVFSFVFDGALAATIFDWVLEPVAIKLGYWQWTPASEIPLFNFTCWFIISALLLTVFRLFRFDKHNQFAIHLFIIQLLFFLVLQSFL